MSSYSNPNLDPKNMYANTIVFSLMCLVGAGLMIVLLRSNRFAEKVDTYATLLITVIIGLFILSIFSLLAVMKHEKELKKRRDAAFDQRRLVNVSACPDYWTLEDNADGKRTCRRQYSADDKVFISMPGQKDTINLNDYDMKPVAKVCGSFGNELKTSWSALKADCDAYSY